MNMAIKNSGEFSHGTANSYNHGCRCQECREAAQLSRKASMLRTKDAISHNPDDPRHGTTYAYNCGCRCVRCIDANSAKKRAEYRARMDRLGKPPRKLRKKPEPKRTGDGHMLLYDSEGNAVGAIRNDGVAAIIMGRYYAVLDVTTDGEHKDIET